VRHLKSPVSPSPQPCNAAFGSAAFGPRGFALPFQIFRLPGRTVANSYPNVDLLWDNVIAGPWGVPPLYSARASPGQSVPGKAGRALYRMREPMIPVNGLLGGVVVSLIVGSGVKAWRRSASDLRRSPEENFAPASFTNDPEHWHKRADEARSLADDMAVLPMI
jgi:hypothetical protein